MEFLFKTYTYFKIIINISLYLSYKLNLNYLYCEEMFNFYNYKYLNKSNFENLKLYLLINAKKNNSLNYSYSKARYKIISFSR